MSSSLPLWYKLLIFVLCPFTSKNYFQRLSDEVVTSATLNINQHISEDFRDFKKSFVVRPELESLIERELIAPFSEKVRAVPVAVAGGREKPERSPPTFAPQYRRDQG